METENQTSTGLQWPVSSPLDTACSGQAFMSDSLLLHTTRLLMAIRVHHPLLVLRDFLHYLSTNKEPLSGHGHSHTVTSLVTTIQNKSAASSYYILLTRFNYRQWQTIEEENPMISTLFFLCWLVRMFAEPLTTRSKIFLPSSIFVNETDNLSI
jgi:hypothetical protein